jgi:capsular exopolysaccharide synthesis family protein
VTQDPLYEAHAQVLLSRQSLANTLAGTTDPAIFQDAERVVQTQAKVAAIPAVAEQTVAAVPSAGLTAQELLRNSSVEPEPNVDLLDFTVQHEDPRIAARLASAYGRAYTRYRTAVETRALVEAREDLRRRIETLTASGSNGPLIQDLRAKEQQLETLESLQTGNASVLRSGGNAEQVRPRPVRNALLGLVLGVGLGVLLAFLVDALDTRVRSADEVAELLRLTLLGRLPRPARRRGRRLTEPAMLIEPDSAAAEAFRMLRTNVDFANLDVHAKTILMTSALAGEGKTTTVANLGIAYALGGKRVVLVDLDLRRPTLQRVFRLPRGPGITDAVLGHASLKRVLAQAPVPGLRVVQAGAMPPNPGEFVASPALRKVLAEIAEDADIVLVDAPPLLQVGDASTTSAAVDAVIVLTRLKMTNRGIVNELRVALDRLPVPTLGFVVTGATESAGYGYAAQTPHKRRFSRRGRFSRRDAQDAPGSERRPRANVRSL